LALDVSSRSSVTHQRSGPLPPSRSPFASQSAAAPPGVRLAHPVGPIRFTPSRVAPIGPPAPLEHAPAGAPAIIGQAGVWVLVALGWAVFIAWWVVVLQRESARSFGVALGLLAATLLATATTMSLWTRHNIRIARLGKRGMSSLYIPMRWERDTLGRPLDLPAPEIVRTAAEVRVVLRGSTKAYLIADGEDL
jgi:hypothetical protein